MVLPETGWKIALAGNSGVQWKWLFIMYCEFVGLAFIEIGNRKTPQNL